MNKGIVVLSTERKGDFPVVDLINDDDHLTIGLHNRVTLNLLRFMDEITIDCDLGIEPDDLCRVGVINLKETKYQDMVLLNPGFVTRARSFEENFFTKKFIRERAKFLAQGSTLGPEKIFGDERTDQVFSNLTDVFNEKITKNLEFSLYRANTMDDKSLKVPIFTLCGSIKYGKDIAQWFFFMTWKGNELLSYGKNVFYNDKSFSDELFKPQKRSLQPA
ncbi:MAG: hypothetical protein WC302_00105 [Candidatus Paceibacterota bacterium]